MGYFDFINKLNFLPTKEDGRFKVRSAQFNDLVTKLNTFFPSIGALTTTSVATDKVVLTKGTATQLTNITTGVTVNASAGVITTVSSTLAANASATFIVTNDKVVPSSVVVVTSNSSASAGLAVATLTDVRDGDFSVTITNLHATTLDDVVEIHFVVV
jgi:hypothetical protein